MSMMRQRQQTVGMNIRGGTMIGVTIVLVRVITDGVIVSVITDGVIVGMTDGVLVRMTDGGVLVEVIIIT